MKLSQAKAFLDTIIGHQLCAGADADEEAAYPVSPIAKAFLQGQIGTDYVQDYAGRCRAGDFRAIGAFLVECGEALQAEADRLTADAKAKADAGPPYS